MGKSRFVAVFEGIACILAVWIFAMFIQRESILQYIAYAGLFLAALMISRSVPDFSALLSAFGITPFSRKAFFYIAAGILFGSALAILNNYVSSDTLLPSLLARFAITAPLIGITEELVFRGYVQTRMAPAGSLASITIASAGHTIYKYLIIRTLPEDLQVNYTLLIVLTFSTGIVFGIFRDRSKNVLPAVLAHAIFDIVVYGGLQSAPVWVWR